MQDKTRNRRKIEQQVCQDLISSLPEDLLVQILLLLPTKLAVSTTILSKRWHSVWMMLPRLRYFDRDEHNVSLWWYIDKSLLQLIKAPVIEKLSVDLRSPCPVNVDVGKWVKNVVARGIQWLDFTLLSSALPIRLSKRLYACKTLKKLNLAYNILVNVPSQASLPSLVDLELFHVVYKDEDSIVRLLSSCHVLQNLFVYRGNHVNDNVTNFSVKVPSLQLLRYINLNRRGSLMIDSPGLEIFNIYDNSRDACLFENIPHCLDMAKVEIDSHHQHDKFFRSLSSVMYLNLTIMNENDAICSVVNFSRLIECKLTPFSSDDWVQSIISLLHNSPNLRVLMINSACVYIDDDDDEEDLPLLSCVPKCLSSRLEILEWEEYKGTREEKEVLTYILANSVCLKTVRVSVYHTYEDEKKKKKMMELESMDRASESSQLIFTTHFRWKSMKLHPAYQVMS